MALPTTDVPGLEALAPEAHSVPLEKNFFWALACNAFYAASHWLMLITLPRLRSPAMVGRYPLALAITAPESPVTGSLPVLPLTGERILAARVDAMMLPAHGGGTPRVPTTP